MKRSLITLLVLLIVTPLVFSLMFKRIPPATVGVKQNQWGSSGVVEADSATGFRLGISGYHKWHYLPTRTHFLHFTGVNSGRYSNDAMSSWANPLEIRTTDNNVVNFELSVAYKIIPGQAYKIVMDGLKEHYTDRVTSVVTAVMRQELPKLTSEDLQLTDLRMLRVEDTLPRLNEQLKEFHCVAEHILIRKLQFQRDYESKLQEKQYFRQKALLDRALTLVAEEEKVVNVIERQIVAAEMAKTQTWEKDIQIKKSEYEVLIAEIEAEARIYAAETLAIGESERVQAEARGAFYLAEADALMKELRTAALNSKGGAIMLALEAAENLNLPEVTLNSDDPAVPTILDLSELTKLLIGAANQ
ncbi:MAG: regulator of protease activity HflC (stomatin/prohibitin superfamily) [Myxococcota bacterium]